MRSDPSKFRHIGVGAVFVLAVGRTACISPPNPYDAEYSDTPDQGAGNDGNPEEALGWITQQYEELVSACDAPG